MSTNNSGWDTDPGFEAPRQQFPSQFDDAIMHNPYDAPQYPAPQAPAPARAQSRAPWVIVAVLSVLLVVALAILFFMMGGSQSRTEVAAPSTTVEYVTTTKSSTPTTTTTRPRGSDYSSARPMTTVTSDEFAVAVGREFQKYVDRSGKTEGTITAHSTVTGKDYSMTCTDYRSYVLCEGGNNAVVKIS
ncbi:putative secreted protein [Corynebacterium renale]|uniref:hypothetical protein n=1 Tax=Corynebacterium renale TaxID=1724 RepID=UPI000DA28F6D|nr:hypothetical protein [Corynebacterium renale]SQG63577.1 putative secreted protein [Corynebacterium renale]STD01011.1 putative secreted protein [Corynebacterium renale]